MWIIRGLSTDVAVKTLHNVFVALRLDVPVGVGGLADTGVPKLTLHPPDVRAALEQPGREGVSRGVIRPVGQLV
jgi:hypothetical protein